MLATFFNTLTREYALSQLISFVNTSPFVLCISRY
jgi:hypothetical protein